MTIRRQRNIAKTIAQMPLGEARRKGIIQLRRKYSDVNFTKILDLISRFTGRSN